MAEKRDFKDFFLDIARHNLNFSIKRVSENHNPEKIFFRGLIFSDLKCCSYVKERFKWIENATITKIPVYMWA